MKHGFWCTVHAAVAGIGIVAVILNIKSALDEFEQW